MRRILFIPFYKQSHQTPLLVLFKKHFANLKEFSCSFLLPKSDSKYCELFQTKRLDFDYSPPTFIDNKNYIDTKAIPSFLKRRNDAIMQFRPNIIVEDFAFDASEFCEQNSIPRISIQRIGYFRTSNPANRNPLHIHSIEKELINGRRYKVFSYKNYSSTSDVLDKDYYVAKYALDPNLTTVFNPQAKIIPGIASIEKLPAVLETNSYYYSGPLIPDDCADNLLLNKLTDFFNEHRSKKKVFVTTGLIEQQDISEIFKHLVKRGYAIITTVFPPYEVDKSKIFYHPFLPLHFVSENVDLIIHHCGSGMYHYPLLHLKPAITLGTQCYDREDVALQLQDLHLSVHVPSPYDDSDYVKIFMGTIDKFENNNLCDYNSLEKTRNIIIDTTQKFKAKKIIESTL